MEQLYIEFLKTKKDQDQYLDKLRADYAGFTPDHSKKMNLTPRVADLENVNRLLSNYTPTILIVCKRNNDDYIGGMGLWIINLEGNLYCCCLGIHKFRSLMEEEYTQNGIYSDTPTFNYSLNVTLALIKTTINLAKHLNIYIIYLPRDCGRGPGRLWSKYGALYAHGNSNSYGRAEGTIMSERLFQDQELYQTWNNEYEKIKNMIKNMKEIVPSGEDRAKFIFFVNNHIKYADIEQDEAKVSITEDVYPNIDELNILSSDKAGTTWARAAARAPGRLSRFLFDRLAAAKKGGGKKKLTKKRTRQTKRRRHTKRRRPTKRRKPTKRKSTKKRRPTKRRR